MKCKKSKDNELKDALKDIKTILAKTGKSLTKDFGKFKVKYKEGTIVKKARTDLSKGLKELARKIKKSADKVKGK